MYEDYGSKYGLPQPGDLMVTGVGTLGICYQVKESDKFYFKDGNILWLRNFDKNLLSTFVKYLYSSPFIANQILATAEGGTVGTYTISNAKNTKVPVPPIEVQRRIIDGLESEALRVKQRTCCFKHTKKRRKH